MILLRVAWRNIFRQKRRTVLTVATMAGGFALSAVSIGWADGTYNRVIATFTETRLGHIQIHGEGYLDRPSLYNQVESYREVGEQVSRTEGVEAWAPRFFAAGLASVENQSAGSQIVGIDPRLESDTTRFNERISQGSPLSVEARKEVVLGEGLAARLKAEPGQELVIVSQAADGSIANDAYVIVGLIESGDSMSDRTSLYMHIQDAQELFVAEGAAHELVIIVDSLDEVRPVADKIRAALDDPDLAVAPWQEFARSFYVAMQADKKGAWISLFIIMLIVAVGVLNTVLMTVLERTREYGVLRAIGTRPAQVFRLVQLEIGFMAFLAIAIGSVIAYIGLYLLSIYGIALPEPFSYGGMVFERFYGEINAHSFYVPAGVVLFSALLVSAAPALRAARLDPAQALRAH